MHPTLKPREEWTRSEIVAFHLNILALHVDPLEGRQAALAEALEMSRFALGRWVSMGYVPWHQVKRLKKRYGKKLVPEDELCPAEYRRQY